MPVAPGMSSLRSDLKFLNSIQTGDLGIIKAALEAGANVDGSQVLPCAPIVAAAMAYHTEVVRFLLDHGADPDKPVREEMPHPCSNSNIAGAMAGERALHIAARHGRIDIVRLLLSEGRADPNATDNLGYTPLMAACVYSQVCVEMVQLLLEAGADPALAENCGNVPLHMAARHCDMDLVDMLHSRAPAALNRCAAGGETPLFLACAGGHESMVSKLLSLGAVQPAPTADEIDTCPLMVAVNYGLVNVVRILINEGGIRAVGGEMALGKAMYTAIACCQARTLSLLLAAGGEEGRLEWANSSIGGERLLHAGAGFCCPAAVSVLLEAGADESALDSEGRSPRDVTGTYPCRMDRGQEVAIRRMLEHGPAYRARSWAWPSDTEVGGGDSGDADTASAVAVLSSPPAMNTPPVIGVRVFWPKEKSSRTSFWRLVGRYCAKG